MSADIGEFSVPSSILDTDLYKLTMQQAVLHHFPSVPATYRFTNRRISTLFSRQCVERYRTAVSHFATVNLTEAEKKWLENTCPYFTKEYLSYLAGFRFKPEQVKIKYIPVTEDGLQGKVEIEITGPWVETILWEVPLMACLSECYFQTVTDWTYDGQEELAYNKARTLFDAGCRVSEFGSRRRRSFKAQETVIKTFVRASKEIPRNNGLTGTSNVHLAQKYDLTPIGTIAHEWFMGIAAIKGYEHANHIALEMWEEVYGSYPSALIALTDTFTTTVFLKEFFSDPELARRWTGLRQDSGDPLLFAPRVKEMYESLGIPIENKTLIYSDALTVDKCLEIQRQCNELSFSRVAFGIGTFLTNDFKIASSGEKSKALNIVIKLSSVEGRPCIKLSDDLTKNTGDQETVKQIRELYHL